MDDPQNIPDPNSPEEWPPEESIDAVARTEPNPPAEPVAAIGPGIPQDSAGQPAGAAGEVAESRRRSFRHNLYLLLSLALAAFILTSWILVRVDSTF
jgi:hypothetical protein